jgi:hypothetical protein
MNKKHVWLLGAGALVLGAMGVAQAETKREGAVASTLEQRVAALEAENAALRQIVQLDGNTVTLSSKGKLRLQSGLDLEVRGANLKLSATENVEMSGNNLRLKAAQNAELGAATALKLNASTIKLNDGTRAVLTGNPPVRDSGASKGGTPSASVPVVLAP